MIVGIYIRVSTREQAEEGYSIGAQKDRLIAYCKAQGWDDYRLYVDEGISAKDMNRPQLKQLMADIQQSKINLILVYRLDRFTRRVRDLHDMLEFLEKHNCKFRSATEMYDTTTAMGRMFIGLVALMAQWEVENMSERISFALEKKVTDGEHVGGAPFGYDVIDEKLVKNEQEGPILMTIIEKIEIGWSAAKMAKYLTELEGRPWYHNSIIRMLRNPAIYGDKQWNGKIIKGFHEPYISKERYDKIQTILDGRVNDRRVDTANMYLFQGIIECPYCNKALKVNRYFWFDKKKNEELQRACYRCPECRKAGHEIPVLNEDKYINALMMFMKTYKIEEVHAEIEPDQHEAEREKLSKELQRINAQREKYQRAWSKDLITDDEFNSRMHETKAQKELIQEKLEKMQPATQKQMIDTSFLNDLIIAFNECFEGLTQEEKRDFIQKFIKKIKIEYIQHPPSPKSIKPKKGRSTVNVIDVSFY